MLVHDDDGHVVQSTKAESGADLVDMVAFLGLLIDESNQRVLWAFQQTSSSHVCIPTPMWHIIFQCQYLRCNSCIFQCWASLFSGLNSIENIPHCYLACFKLCRSGKARYKAFWDALSVGHHRWQSRSNPLKENVERKKILNNELRWNCRESIWKWCYKRK